MAFNVGYRQGLFGGAPFYTAQTQDSFGRRGVHHEFPYKDRGLWDDLGAKDAERKIEVYVTNKLSGGFTSARDALKAALDKGDGELVHPWLGRHKVVCTDYAITHVEEELGVCRFSITFIDCDTAAAKPKANPVSGLLGSCGRALAKLAELTADTFTLRGALAYVSSITGGRLGQFLDKVQGSVAVIDKVVAVMRPFVDTALKVYGLVRTADFSLSGFLGDKVDFLKVSFTSLESTSLTKELVGVVSLSSPAAGSPAQAYAHLTGLSDMAATMPSWVAPPRAVTAKSVAMITNNLDSMSLLFQGAAAIESAKLIPFLEFEHQEQAESIKVDFLSRFDALLLKVDDELYRLLVGVTAAALEIISLKTPSLAKLGHKTLLADLPSVVLAYDLYENLELESDLVGRNGIVHPGWVPAGRPMEYLNRA
ncbi:MAG: DNA circularization N-terminal domain-containing protein [Deltaproteobacteria bacterium]|jgi:prophage DNA circulation protein|nr:DNA circularization N-terminal domain-containing protein [Deltaproteobacteria bacterium]